MKAEPKPLNDAAQKKVIAERIASHKACNPSLADRWPKQGNKK